MKLYRRLCQLSEETASMYFRLSYSSRKGGHLLHFINLDLSLTHSDVDELLKNVIRWIEEERVPAGNKTGLAYGKSFMISRKKELPDYVDNFRSTKYDIPKF